MAKELKDLTKRADNYSQWFNDLVVKADLAEQAVALTGLQNPNSTAQVKKWLEEQEGIEVPSLNKKQIADVAEEIHRSSSYLMRRFKAELGMSVGDYITKCKLDEACDLLTYGDRSLAEISAYLGYSSQSYFQNVFKKQFGMTPMQYRKHNRKQS